MKKLFAFSPIQLFLQRATLVFFILFGYTLQSSNYIYAQKKINQSRTTLPKIINVNSKAQIQQTLNTSQSFDISKNNVSTSTLKQILKPVFSTSSLPNNDGTLGGNRGQGKNKTTKHEVSKSIENKHKVFKTMKGKGKQTVNAKDPFLVEDPQRNNVCEYQLFQGPQTGKITTRISILEPNQTQNDYDDQTQNDYDQTQNDYDCQDVIVHEYQEEDFMNSNVHTYQATTADNNSKKGRQVNNPTVQLKQNSFQQKQDIIPLGINAKSLKENLQKIQTKTKEAIERETMEELKALDPVANTTDVSEYNLEIKIEESQNTIKDPINESFIIHADTVIGYSKINSNTETISDIDNNYDVDQALNDDSAQLQTIIEQADDIINRLDKILTKVIKKEEQQQAETNLVNIQYEILTDAQEQIQDSANVKKLIIDVENALTNPKDIDVHTLYYPIYKFEKSYLSKMENIFNQTNSIASEKEYNFTLNIITQYEEILNCYFQKIMNETYPCGNTAATFVGSAVLNINPYQDKASKTVSEWENNGKEEYQSKHDGIIDRINNLKTQITKRKDAEVHNTMQNTVESVAIIKQTLDIILKEINKSAKNWDTDSTNKKENFNYLISHYNLVTITNNIQDPTYTALISNMKIQALNAIQKKYPTELQEFLKDNIAAGASGNDPQNGTKGSKSDNKRHYHSVDFTKYPRNLYDDFNKCVTGKEPSYKKNKSTVQGTLKDDFVVQSIGTADTTRSTNNDGESETTNNSNVKILCFSSLLLAITVTGTSAYLYKRKKKKAKIKIIKQKKQKENKKEILNKQEQVD